MNDPRKFAFARELANFALWALLACAICSILCASAFPQTTYYSNQQRRGLFGLRRSTVVYTTSGAGQLAPIPSNTASPASSWRPAQLTTYGRGPCYGGVCPMPPATPIQRAPTPTPAIDYSRIIEAMARDPRFRGPPGRDGDRGRDGAPGQPGKDGAPGQPTKLRDDERQAIVDRIAAELRTDLEFEAINLDQLATRVAELLAGQGAPIADAQLERLAERIAAIERAKISIEMFDADGKLIQAQQRTLGGEPFYFGQRPTN